jgi:hypothetical protein
MTWEQQQVGANMIPARYTWGALKNIDDDVQRLARYHQGLRKLSEQRGLVGLIFAKPQSKINDPAKLHLLIQMIDGENWSSLDVDVKGEVYEGLLARNADDVRGGAGQYFTPRPVIRAIVEVMRPRPMMQISDPACGTGGFLLAASSRQNLPMIPNDSCRLLPYVIQRWASALEPTARMRSSRMATAWAAGAAGFNVTILPLRSTRSAF